MARLYKPLPSAEELWELFEYKPLKGELVWRIRPSNRVFIGSTAGSPHSKGYSHIRIKNQAYLVHRLIWNWLHGEDPKAFQIDHVDGNRLNNTWGNLRLATPAQNSYNCKPRSHNSLGVKGVRVTAEGRYQARIRKAGVVRYLGNFDTVEEASEAYKKAAVELHGEFFRLK